MGVELWFRNIFYWIFTVRFFEDELAVNNMIRYAVEYPHPQSAIAFRNQVNAIASYDCTEALSRIDAKTMVISGKEDILFPTEVCARLARAIPGAVYSVINNAAHSIHMEQPRAFTESILEFLCHHKPYSGFQSA